MADIQQGLQGQFNDLLPEKLAKKTSQVIVILTSVVCIVNI